MSGESIGLMWFRRDLRVADNPALASAAIEHERVATLFVLDPVVLRSTPERRVAVLVAHLRALDVELRRLGGNLHVEFGRPAEVLTRLARRLDTTSVYVNVDSSRYAQARDRDVEASLGVALERSFGNTVHPPGSVLTQKGTLSRVFSPFFRTWERRPLDRWPSSEMADRLMQLDGGDPLPDTGTEPAPAAGEKPALAKLAQWDDDVDAYLETRDIPGVEGTSTLSSELKFGVVAARRVIETIGTETPGRAAFVRQLAWRDWWAHMLTENPGLSNESMRSDYADIDWRNDPGDLRAWQEGMTGFPVVDAGMRQLRATGWMHNRVRMICASFLVKDLLIDWRLGERYFREQLLDADIPQNVGNWQWVAGTGPDAAPYFRVFNPTAQGQKFDADGTYVRRWVPELAQLGNAEIHEPSKVGPIELATAGVVLGQDYPYPIVDHKQARVETIEAYKSALSRSRSS